mgnify:FL=1
MSKKIKSGKNLQAIQKQLYLKHYAKNISHTVLLMFYTINAGTTGRIKNDSIARSGKHLHNAGNK